MENKVYNRIIWCFVFLGMSSLWSVIKLLTLLLLISCMNVSLSSSLCSFQHIECMCIYIYLYVYMYIFVHVCIHIHIIYIYAELCLVALSCLTLCNPMDCSPAGSSVHGDSLGKNTGISCHALLWGIVPTQRSNPGLLHCRQILHLSHKGSTGVDSLSLLQGIFPTQESNRGLLHYRQILYQLSYQGSPYVFVSTYNI